MHEFNRIFDGKNVIGLGFVDAVENRGQGRRLSRSRRPGDQHDSVLQVGDPSQFFWELQFGKTGNALRNHPHHNRVAAPLDKDIDPKARRARQAIRNVARALLLQHGQSLFVIPNQFPRDALRIFCAQRRQSRHFEWNQLAAYLHVRMTSRGKDQVANMGRNLQHG